MLVAVPALSLGAALLLATGFVVQQRAAAKAPADERLSPRILIDLAHRPLWLAGIGAMIAGQIVGAVALDQGSLPLVEPLLATNLLFALPMSAAWARQRLRAREWTGAIMLSIGLAGFVIASNPADGPAGRVSEFHWVLAAAVVASLVAAFIAVGKHSDLAEEATFLAAGAGVLYGLQDALTRRTLQLLGSGGVVHMLTGWQPWVLVAVAIGGLILAQSAFEAAPLAASLPALTIAEPIVGIGLGVGLFAEQIDLEPGRLAAELAGILFMIVGVILVARSPLVTGQVQPPESAREGQREAA